MSMMLLSSQGTELLVDSVVAEELVEQRGELPVLLSQGGSHGVRKVRDHWPVVEPRNSWLCFMENSSPLMASRGMLESVYSSGNTRLGISFAYSSSPHTAVESRLQVIPWAVVGNGGAAVW